MYSSTAEVNTIPSFVPWWNAVNTPIHTKWQNEIQNVLEIRYQLYPLYFTVEYGSDMDLIATSFYDGHIRFQTHIFHSGVCIKYGSAGGNADSHSDGVSPESNIKHLFFSRWPLDPILAIDFRCNSGVCGQRECYKCWDAMVMSKWKAAVISTVSTCSATCM